MIVVSDTSAITSLIQIGEETILHRLFSRVIIPPAVRDELLQFHQTLPGFLEIVEPAQKKRVIELLEELDAGESEAIALAEETGPDYLLIDDLAARTVAIAKGLPVIGLLGVLVKAKRSRAIDSMSKQIFQIGIGGWISHFR